MRFIAPNHDRRPDPTPAEIRRLCLEIQRTWDRRTRLERAGRDPHYRFTLGEPVRQQLDGRRAFEPFDADA